MKLIANALLFSILMLSPIGSNGIAAVIAEETSVRALYILNFANFIRWPENNMQDTSTTVICTLSQNSVGEKMKGILGNESDKVAVRQAVPLNLLKHCHIVYIDGSDSSILGSVFTVLKPYPVLTVSPLPGFIEQGGNIGFLNQEQQLGLYSDRRVQYEINLTASKSVNLQLDPRLLELASRVIGG